MPFTPLTVDIPFPENPLTGFVVWGKSPEFENVTQPWSMLFARLYWCQVEPHQGRFQWEKFEQSWHFDRAIGNKKIVLRLVLDNPGDHLPGTDKEIPEWLYKATGSAGVSYDDPALGRGFSPDYTHQAMIAGHRDFIAALGERYNHDPRIAFIQIGSLGHWGEWHTWPAGSGGFPPYPVAEMYVEHYQSAFPDKMLLVRRPLGIQARAPALGLYNDVIGAPGTVEWLDWISQGYTSEWDAHSHPALDDTWWHTACSAGELAAHEQGVGWWLSDELFPETLRQIGAAHTSWIGPSAPGKLGDSHRFQDKIERLLSTMGYHLAFKNIAFKKKAGRGEGFTVSFKIENSGIAPFYYPWPFEISLIDGRGEIAHKHQAPECDIRTWLPGETKAETILRIPPSLEPGQYSLSFAVLDPHTHEAAVDFSLDQRLRRPDRRYVVGRLAVD